MKVPFLQDLGVMTQDGKIVRTRFDSPADKRFLELLRYLPQLDKDRETQFWTLDVGNLI